MEEKVLKCARLIEESSFTVALSGAGISTSAGIPDFRGPKGIYTMEKYDPEKAFDINYFLQDPKPFYKFAKDLLKLIDKLKPTFTHYFLAKLESAGELQAIITQNIDTLHQKAGSKNVVEVHGSIKRSFCVECGNEFSYERMKEKVFTEKIPHCSCGGVIKPDIVFYGEIIKYLTEAQKLVHQSDLLLVIGSSLVVYPVATLPNLTTGEIVLVNKGEVDTFLNRTALFAQEDIDNFFRKVSRQLGLGKGVRSANR